MEELWEEKFRNEGAMWKFEPANSAEDALKTFNAYGIKNILIPGVGYGRNAKIFYDNGFNVTGIEISKSAIEIAKSNGLTFPIHHGSVTSMPFDNQQYDGIFCYALLHLLNRFERKSFVESCGRQLKAGGIMIFVVTSKLMDMYGSGKFISKDRFEISKGLKVYFYDIESLSKEFSNFKILECKDIEEPIKFAEGYEPMKLIRLVCKKEK